jgi:hypothetical protein
MPKVKISLDRTVYHQGQSIEISVDTGKSTRIFNHSNYTNISICRLGEKRDERLFPSGAYAEVEKGKQTTIHLDLSKSNLSSGIYFIQNFTIISQSDTDTKNKIIQTNQVFFKVVESEEFEAEDGFDMDAEVKLIRLKQKEYQERIITTDFANLNLTPKHKYRVLMFAVGIKLRNIQILPGYKIIDLNKGFKPKYMLDVIKLSGIKLQYNPEIHKDFSRSTPISVIEFHCVEAINNQDAINYITHYCETLFDFLGVEQGQRPVKFAHVVFSSTTGKGTYGLSYPIYRGNVASPFSPSFLTEKMEEALSTMKSDPWIELLYELCSSAITEAEKDNDFAHFKMWSILELIADKKIPNNIEIKGFNGKHIQDKQGQKITTKTKVGKVYQLIFESNMLNHTFSSQIPGHEHSVIFELSSASDATPPTKSFSLWEGVSALYAIRNAVAHEGKFSLTKAEKGNSAKAKIAAELYKIKPDILRNLAESWIKHILDKRMDYLLKD